MKQPVVNGPLEFGDSVGVDRSYEELLEVQKILALRPVARTFIQNMNRLLALPYLLGNGIFNASLQSRAVGFVAFHTGVPGLDAIVSTDFEAQPRYSIHAAMFREWAASLGKDLDSASFTYGCNFLEDAADHPGSHQAEIVSGVESLYFGMVLNSYAAFEALVGDLWIATVNLHPSLYTDKKGASEKQITLGDLAMLNYNLEGRIGEFAKVAGTVNFQSRGGIESAYKELYGSASDPYHALKGNTELTKTEKIRHLIAHQGGKVDLKFTQDMKGTEFESAVIDKTLPLAGKQVANLINACVKTGVKLVKSVDAWVVNHENKPK